MKCDEARFAVAAEPASPAADLADHLASCASCAAYAQEMRALDGALRRALTVPVPDVPLPDLRQRTASAAVRGRFSRRLALAAGLAGVAMLAGVLWIGVPRPSLASAVVQHMSHEPESWGMTDALPAAEVSRVLAESGVALRAGWPGVTYANRCWFRGRYVPHLVVQTGDGPVTVMVLPSEKVTGQTRFEEGGYRGVLVPAARGSLAVIARDHGDVEYVAGQALAAIEFSGHSAAAN